MTKPFIKWVGGKTQLLSQLQSRMPGKYNRYFEPFVGGGAMLLDLDPQDACISDANEELINTYHVVKNKPFELMDYLDNCANDEDVYYQIRGLDRDVENFSSLSSVERAGRFVYLNKTCFNGLHRTNKQGHFNVSWGKRKRVSFYSKDNILDASKALQDVEIASTDFLAIKDKVAANDFVYLDPPYDPVSDTANFVGYTKNGFADDMQTKVRDLCDHINKVGAYFMLSNAATDRIFELYQDYKVDIVEARRSINCKGDHRGKVGEVIVTNY